MEVGVIIVLLGMFSFCFVFTNFWYFSVIGIIYCILFGAMIILFTFFFPRIIQALFGFYITWIGRGLFFILVGGLIISLNWWDIIIGVVVIVIGIIFCFLEIPYLRFVSPPRGIIPVEMWF